MFTGIIETTGTVVDLRPTAEDGATLIVRAGALADALREGDSLAVAGVCLTATPAEEPGLFRADLMGETLRRTVLGTLSAGDTVNLERSIPAGGRLDGHVVQGHVDATGTVVAVTDLGDWTRMRLAIPAEIAPLVSEKGSIAVDGTSLTITAVSEPDAAPEPWFEVGLIPTTLRITTLGRLRPGGRVNLETDVLAKYVARLAGFAPSCQGEPS